MAKKKKKKVQNIDKAIAAIKAGTAEALPSAVKRMRERHRIADSLTHAVGNLNPSASDFPTTRRLKVFEESLEKSSGRRATKKTRAKRRRLKKVRRQ